MSLQILSILLGSLAIASALMVVISRHPVRSVIYLVVTFFFITSLYIMMNAQFLAIVNMIVYAGAIMVLFLFVLMLLNLNKEEEGNLVRKSSLFGSIIAAGTLFLVLVSALKDSFILKSGFVPKANNYGLVKELGELLFSKYLLPFEVSSILFISAMVGAVLLAKREKPVID